MSNQQWQKSYGLRALDEDLVVCQDARRSDRPSSFVEIMLVMIITQFLAMFEVYVCLD